MLRLLILLLVKEVLCSELRPTDEQVARWTIDNLQLHPVEILQTTADIVDGLKIFRTKVLVETEYGRRHCYVISRLVVTTNTFEYFGDQCQYRRSRTVMEVSERNLFKKTKHWFKQEFRFSLCSSGKEELDVKSC